MFFYVYLVHMNIKRTVLKNGLRIVTVPMKDSPTVTVQVLVAAGARYETEKNNGISHFLEHMCFKGTTRRTALEIAYELEAMGALSNAFTNYDMTGYYAKGRAALFLKLLDIVADVYLNSLFPESEIEKEKGVVCGEIDMINDNPQHKVGYTFLKSLYGDQPAGRSIAGPKENIKRFTRKDFINYHKQHYHAEKTVVVVTGDIDQKKTIDMVKKAFATIPTKKISVKKKIVSKKDIPIIVETRKTDQTHIVLGMQSIPFHHPDRRAFSVLNGILGQGMSSRLFFKLREEMGAGYYVYSDFSSSDDTGEFAIATGTEPARVAEVLSAIKGELKKLCDTPVSGDELAKTKEYMIGKLYMGMELSDDIANLVGMYEIFNQPQKTVKDLEKEIRAITVSDVSRVAKKYFKLDQLHLAVIGPHTESEIKKVI